MTSREPPVRSAVPTRREKVEAMLAEQPHDSFLRYALAMEFDKEGAHDRSLELLGDLTRNTPPHVPAFFMAAQQLARLARVAEARTFLREGINAARQQGNTHAASEMSELLMSLGAQGE